MLRIKIVYKILLSCCLTLIPLAKPFLQSTIDAAARNAPEQLNNPDSLNIPTSQSDLLLYQETDSIALATKLMIAKRSQSATAITGRLLERLQKEGRFNSYFGLKTRLIHGSALIHAKVDRSSFDFLWQLKDDSKSGEHWDIFAETCRVIASILSYSGRKDQSLQNLREAQVAIREHQLDSVYPHFAVRISSWHRMHGDRDSSIFYANEAIREAPKFTQVFEEAEGHLLLAMNYAKSNVEKAAYHYNTGAKLYRAVEEFTSYCGMHIGLAKLALHSNKAEEGLTYLDTVIQYLPLTFDNNIRMRHRVYQLKAVAFEQLAQLDSAIYYLKKGHAVELENLTAENLEKVVEIDNIYNVEKKTQELEAQKLEVQKEKKRRRLLVALISLILLLPTVLIFYLLQFRKANRLTLQQAEKLKNLDAAKSRFFTNISHELRTPLTLMLGPIRILLKDNQLTEKQSKLLKMADQNGSHLQTLLQEILDLRKLEMGKLELQLEPTLLAIFFRRQTAMFESLAERKQIDFSFKTNLDDELVAELDREKCRQIINNLLSNAFKFTPEGGKISGSLSQIGDFLQIKVTDTGSGIPPDEIPYIFDRFFQTNRLDKAMEGGTGIGLALCQQYAKLLKGNIEVKSTLGEGTEFLISFPLLLTEATHAEVVPHITESFSKSKLTNTAKEPNTGSSGTRPNILVVEDNVQLQDYICLILQDKYNVVTADNGQAALAVIKSEFEARKTQAEVHQFPDLILSDLMMPVMDGFQLLSTLKKEEFTRHIPVIMLTARAEQQDKLKALRIGVDDYLTKPFDDKELLVRIKNLLQHRSDRSVAEEVETKEPTALQTFSQEDLQWLESFENYVLQHYTNSSLSIPTLADEFAMSQSTLLRQLKRLTGLTPVRYIQEVRLDQARQLLEKRLYDSINRVSYEVGYRDTRAFSRNFKKRFGRFPSEV